MKIGIISDTHYYNPDNCYVQDWIKTAFEGVELIVHAGDIEHESFVRNLEYIAPVYAVKGNCDSYDSRNPVSLSINVGCGLLTVAHRPGDAYKALELNSKIMVYGHTHVATISHENGLLIINPGSPTMPRGGMLPSVAVLEIDDGEPKARIVFK